MEKDSLINRGLANLYLNKLDDAIDDDTKISQWITSVVSWIKELEYNRRWNWITRFI